MRQARNWQSALTNCSSAALRFTSRSMAVTALPRAGAVACQILDSIYPGEVPMSKVRWDSKSSHEWVGNYKIVQQVLQKKGCDKYIGEGRSGGARAETGVGGPVLSRPARRGGSCPCFPCFTIPHCRPPLSPPLPLPVDVEKLIRGKYQVRCVACYCHCYCCTTHAGRQRAVRRCRPSPLPLPSLPTPCLNCPCACPPTTTPSPSRRTTWR